MPIDLHVKSLASICNRFTADLLIIHKTSNDSSTAKKNELDDYSVNYAGWLFVWSLYCECCLTTGSAVIQNYQYTYCDEAWIKRLINDAMTFKLHVVFYIILLRARVAQWVRQLDYLTTHTILSPIRRGFTPGFVNYKKGTHRLAAASDKLRNSIVIFV